MGMLRKSGIVTLLVMLFGTMFACAHMTGANPGRAESGATGPLYTAYNMWYEHPENVSSVNYHRGAMIPAGTPVSDARASARRIKFTTANGVFTIAYSEKYHPGMTAEAFKNRMLTNKDFAQLTAGMSPAEIECIKTGTVQPGVSKACVLVAYGYPPEHVTPSLDQNMWMYWQDRFRRTAVNFNEAGRTIGAATPVQNTRARSN